jgi:hypothetical protein
MTQRRAAVAQRGSAAARRFALACALFAVPSLSAAVLGAQEPAPPSWVLARPPAATQTEKSIEERGGDPCKLPDPGFGEYRKWDRSPVLGEMILPKAFKLAPNGTFDVVFHFHYHDRARINWVQTLRSGILVGIDLGVLSGPYVAKFNGTDQFEQMVQDVEQIVRKRSGSPRAHAGRVALSSWSAGYGAVGGILRSDYGQRVVDTVILLDGLHTDRVDAPAGEASLAPFVDFAKRAAKGETLMYVSHSSVLPKYASTTTTANYLIWQVGGKPQPVRHAPEAPYGLERISEFSAGNLHVLGYSGNGRSDHCAQFALYQDALRNWLAPRWGLATVKEPKATKPDGTKPDGTKPEAAKPEPAATKAEPAEKETEGESDSANERRAATDP